MDTIKELFYGNIHPFERDVPKDSEGDKLQIVAKLKDALTEQSSLCECEGFINGFRLGVRLMAESFYGGE